MDKNNANGYEVSDFYLTAYLTCRGYQILDTRKDGRRTIFILENSNGLEKEVRDFFNRQVKVVPLDYKNSIQDLKTLLFSLDK